MWSSSSALTSGGVRGRGSPEAEALQLGCAFASVSFLWFICCSKAFKLQDGDLPMLRLPVRLGRAGGAWSDRQKSQALQVLIPLL